MAAVEKQTPVVFGDFPASVSFEFVERLGQLDLELISQDVASISKHPEFLALSRIYESQFSLLLGEVGVQPFAVFDPPANFYKIFARIFGHKLFLGANWEDDLSSEDSSRFTQLIDAVFRPSHQTLALFEKDRGALRELFRVIGILNQDLEFVYSRLYTVRA